MIINFSLELDDRRKGGEGGEAGRSARKIRESSDEYFFRVFFYPRAKSLEGKERRGFAGNARESEESRVGMGGGVSLVVEINKRNDVNTCHCNMLKRV